MSSRFKHRYQDQTSELTLQQGIGEYYDANPHLLFPAGLEDEVARFFRCHDRIHVVFGCDTSLVHEARADFWTMLGSDVGIFGYLRHVSGPAIRVLLKDVKEKFEKEPDYKMNLRKEFRQSAFAMLVAPLQVFRRTRKMSKRWPWLESEAFLDRPLKELRDENGIQVIRSQPR